MEHLLPFRTWNYSERDKAVRAFLDALGVDGPDASFVYLTPEDEPYLDAHTAKLRSVMTKKLVAVVDALKAKAGERNLYGSPDLATSFHCLSAPSKAHALRDSGLAIEEVDVLDPSATMRTRFAEDAREEMGGWLDTVLEGPYQLEGEIEPQSVTELRLSGVLVALRVTLGAPAVVTDTCEVAEDDTWPEECARGEITQNLYYDAQLARIHELEEGAEFEHL